MTFSAIHWDIAPEIIKIGSFEIRWYGLLFAASFYFGFLIFRKIFKNENIAESWLDKLTIYMVVGTVIGARLGHCLFYQPDYYLSHPLEILQVWKGGLASHGAAIGILVALWYYSKKINKPYLWILDRIAIVIALAGFFIRMGNLMNSEIYGTVTNLPWGVIFERRNEIHPKHPTQIYEALSYLCIFIFVFKTYWKEKGQIEKGRLFGIFLIALFSMRFLIEFIKEDQVGFEDGMSLNMGQLLSIPFILTGIIILYKSFKRKEQ